MGTNGEEKEKPAEKTELRHSTFECAACGSGTENFLTLFSDGTCSRCGNPAGVVVETSTPEDVGKIRQSIMIVSSEEDSQTARQIMKDMLDEGVSVIDPTLVVDNERAGNRANVLAFLTNECKFVLVIPSKNTQISKDRLIAASVEQAITNRESSVVPLYPDSSYRGRPSLLGTRMGVLWKGSGDMVWGRDRFVNSLKKGGETRS
jgi:hypothetical protein